MRESIVKAARKNLTTKKLQRYAKCWFTPEIKGGRKEKSAGKNCGSKQRGIDRAVQESEGGDK